MNRLRKTTTTLLTILFLASIALTFSSVYAGGAFGGYVRTIAKAGLPDCLETLGLDFGTIFVSSTANTPLDITQHTRSGSNCERNYCASPDIDEDGHPDYAAQWFTSVVWKIPGNDYVIIWSKNPIPGHTPNTSLDFDLQWVKDLHDPEVPLAGHGVYHAYFFDVTG